MRQQLHGTTGGVTRPSNLAYLKQDSYVSSRFLTYNAPSLSLSLSLLHFSFLCSSLRCRWEGSLHYLGNVFPRMMLHETSIEMDEERENGRTELPLNPSRTITSDRTVFNDSSLSFSFELVGATSTNRNY